MRKCLFCDNPAKTREHVWPQWILERLRIKDQINRQVGKEKDQLIPPELKIRAVCQNCNGGWMSALETANIPLIGNFLQDVALSLDGFQQYTISLWAMKMAMIGEFLSRSHRQEFFFSQADREQLRVASNLPERTTIWLGRHSASNHIGFWATDAWSVDKTVHAFVNTVLVGRLAVQTLSLRVSEEHFATDITVQPKNGPQPWERALVTIWPTNRTANWPPAFSFRENRTNSIYRLVRRYSYGENIL